MTKHNHRSRFQPLLLHRLSNGAWILKTHRTAAESRGLHARDLEHHTLGRQITKTDLHIGIGLERGVCWSYEILISRNRWDILKVFFEGCAGDGQATPIQQAHVEKVLQKQRCSTQTVQIHHGALSSRGKIT